MHFTQKKRLIHLNEVTFLQVYSITMRCQNFGLKMKVIFFHPELNFNSKVLNEKEGLSWFSFIWAFFVCFLIRLNDFDWLTQIVPCLNGFYAIVRSYDSIDFGELVKTYLQHPKSVFCLLLLWNEIILWSSIHFL